MTQTISRQQQIEILKKEKADLELQLNDAKNFFSELTIIRLPLTVKGHPAIILECMVSTEIAEKIKSLINDNTTETTKPAESTEPVEPTQQSESYDSLASQDQPQSPLPSSENHSQFPSLIIDGLKDST